MSPSIAILLASLLQAGLKLLERELGDDEKKEVEETAEKIAALGGKKETETA